MGALQDTAGWRPPAGRALDSHTRAWCHLPNPALGLISNGECGRESAPGLLSSKRRHEPTGTDAVGHP